MRLDTMVFAWSRSAASLRNQWTQELLNRVHSMNIRLVRLNDRFHRRKQLQRGPADLAGQDLVRVRHVVSLERFLANSPYCEDEFGRQERGELVNDVADTAELITFMATRSRATGGARTHAS